MKPILLLSFVFLTSVGALGILGAEAPIPHDSSPNVILDPKTKVLYYLESDLRHIAAISPDGNLLWCCEVVPKSPYKILSFSLDEKDQSSINVHDNDQGLPNWGRIDKKTGVYTSIETE